jgi:hypothetical protein
VQERYTGPETHGLLAAIFSEGGLQSIVSNSDLEHVGALLALKL